MNKENMHWVNFISFFIFFCCSWKLFKVEQELAAKWDLDGMRVNTLSLEGSVVHTTSFYFLTSSTHYVIERVFFWSGVSPWIKLFYINITIWSVLSTSCTHTQTHTYRHFVRMVMLYLCYVLRLPQPASETVMGRLPAPTLWTLTSVCHTKAADDVPICFSLWAKGGEARQ